MSYCRFSDGDVYMYESVDGVECCACMLAPMVRTIFTAGGEVLGVVIEPCEECDGAGCDSCLMHDNMTFDTKQAALDHLRAHKAAGHSVPNYAIDELEDEIMTEAITAPDGAR